MKKFMKMLSFVFITAFILNMGGWGMSAVRAESTFEPGTYTASAPGMNGDVEVEVVVSADAIVSIEISNHRETPGISDPALENIPEAIIAAQGLKVDGVAGATFTSDAILAAVTDCLEQAGADVDALKEIGAEPAALEDEVLETDVVVVGAGIAGLSAAIAAAEAGADVILLEKMGSVGGASMVCGGEILAAGTEMQAAQGLEDSVLDLKAYWIAAGEGNVNEDLVGFVAENSGTVVEWLKERGVPFGAVEFSYNYPDQDPYRNHSTTSGSGADFVLPLTEKAKELGVDIRLETPAVSLLNEDGVITGVIAENGGRTVTVHAASTILATGGYANNEALMKEYAPKVGAWGTFLGETHQGDGLVMARDAGAEIVAGGGAIANPMDLGPTGYADAQGRFLNVTPEGVRFANENEYWFSRSADLYFNEGFNYYFGIMDSKEVNEGFDAAIEAGSAFRAETLEALAEQLGIDEAVFTETVARYNEMCETGEDLDFGKPAVGLIGNKLVNLEETTLLTPIDEAPYYAVKFSTLMVTGTFGGPKVNLDGEVISTEGSIIPGLYAAGEVANGEFFYHRYPTSGSSIQMSASMGIQAGKAAAANAE